MAIKRTPEHRFEGLPDFPYEPGYSEIGDPRLGALRIAWVEDGPANGELVLCLHGGRSWSFVYRKMLPLFAAAGIRAVAPDLVGFGRSDKPSERSDYSYASHLSWLRSFLDVEDLQDITLVCQDWGGLLGLRLVAEQPDRFRRVVVANTFLPTGDRPMPLSFLAWQAYSQRSRDFAIGSLFEHACKDLSDEVIAAYDAPFPDESYKAGARQFPVLVPTRPDDPEAEANRQAWGVLARWTKPMLTAFSDGDPIMRGADRVFHKVVPGCSGMPHTTIEGAGHFIQEDKGEDFARAIIAFIEATPC